MQNVSAYTSIPVLLLIHHSGEVDSIDVGSPYIIITELDGVALRTT